MSEFKYRAFISYSHRDRATADWLHKGLESYRVPKPLIGTTGKVGPVPAKLYPIFRDRDELPASPELGPSLQGALRSSAWLVVICSPDSAKSLWVNEEILFFKRLGRSDRILALIADGEPHAGDTRECFPQALKFKLNDEGDLSSDRAEPIGADARPHGDGRENALLKVLAGILGVGFEQLKQRELEAARRRARIARSIATFMTVLALAAAVGGTLAWLGGNVARERLDASLIAQSRIIAEKSRDVQPEIAIPALLSVLPNSLDHPDRPYVSEAASRLAMTLDLARDVKELVAEPTQQVRSIRFPTERQELVAVTGSQPATVAVWDLSTGATLFKQQFDDGVFDADLSPDGATLAVVERRSGAPIKTFSIRASRPQVPLWLTSQEEGWPLVQGAGQASDGSLVVAYEGGWGFPGIQIASLDGATGRVTDLVSESCSGAVAKQVRFLGSSLLLADCNNGKLTLWKTGARMQRLAEMRGRIDSMPNDAAGVAVSKTGSHLAIGPDENGNVTVRDLQDTTRSITRSVSGSNLRLMAFPTEGGELLVIDSYGDGRVITWNDEDRVLSRESTGLEFADVQGAGLSRDGSKLLLALADGTLELWSWREWRRLSTVTLSDGSDGVSAIAPSQNADEMLLLYSSRKLERRKADDGELIASTQGFVGEGGIVTGPDDTVFVSDGKQTICSWTSGEEARCHRLAGEIRSVSPLSDRGSVLVGLDAGPKVYSASDFAEQLAPAAPIRMEAANLVRFDRTGKRLAIAFLDKTVVLFNVETGAPVLKLGRRDGDINEIAFDAEGTFLVIRKTRQVEVFDTRHAASDPSWTADIEAKSVAFKDDLVLFGTAGGDTRAYAIATGARVPDREPPSERGALVMLSANGYGLYSDRTGFAVWPEQEAGAVTRHPTLDGPFNFPMAAISRDGELVAVAYQTFNSIRIRAATEFSRSKTPTGLDRTDPVIAAAFNSAGDRVLAGVKSGRTFWIDASTGAASATHPCDCGEITGVFSGPAGRMLVVGKTAALLLGEETRRIAIPAGVDGVPSVDAALNWLVLDEASRLNVVALDSGKVAELVGPSAGIRGFRGRQRAWLSRDTGRLAYVSEGRLKVSELRSGTDQRTLELSGNVAHGAIAHNGRVLVLVFDNDMLQSIDLDNGSVRFTAPLSWAVNSMEFIDAERFLLHHSQGGAMVASSARDEVIFQLKDTLGRPFQPEAVKAAGNEQYIGILPLNIIKAAEGQAIVWAGPDAQPSQLLPLDRSWHTWVPMSRPASIAASSDGRHAFVYGENTTPNLLRLGVRSHEVLLDEACRRIMRPLTIEEQRTLGLLDQPELSSSEKVFSHLPVAISKFFGVPPRTPTCQ